jgi:hypothetical protein
MIRRAAVMLAALGVFGTGIGWPDRLGEMSMWSAAAVVCVAS